MQEQLIKYVDSGNRNLVSQITCILHSRNNALT